MLERAASGWTIRGPVSNCLITLTYRGGGYKRPWLYNSRLLGTSGPQIGRYMVPVSKNAFFDRKCADKDHRGGYNPLLKPQGVHAQLFGSGFIGKPGSWIRERESRQTN